MTISNWGRDRQTIWLYCLYEKVPLPAIRRAEHPIAGKNTGIPAVSSAAVPLNRSRRRRPCSLAAKSVGFLLEVLTYGFELLGQFDRIDFTLLGVQRPQFLCMSRQHFGETFGNCTPGKLEIGCRHLIPHICDSFFYNRLLKRFRRPGTLCYARLCVLGVVHLPLIPVQGMFGIGRLCLSRSNRTRVAFRPRGDTQRFCDV